MSDDLLRRKMLWRHQSYPQLVFDGRTQAEVEASRDLTNCKPKRHPHWIRQTAKRRGDGAWRVG